MKDVVDITVSQVRVFPIDSLPFNELRVPANATQLQQAFKFGNVQIDPFGVQVTLTNGVFEHRGKISTVSSLSFEQRKILVQIRGESQVADAFYGAAYKIIQSLGNRPKSIKIEPLLKAEETVCIATLDIDFDDLIAPGLWKFIQTDAKKRFHTPYGNPRSVTVKSLSFDVKYEPTDPRLAEYDVALSNKLFTIEPRIGTPLSERRFLTSSPTDSDTHFAILEQIEKEISKGHATKSAK